MTDFAQTLNDFITQPETPHDDVARRAYAIYVSSGCLPGRCEQNWLQAERELRRLIQEARRTETSGAPTRRLASEETPLRSATSPKSSGRNSSREKATSATKSRHASQA